tara:strand:- start:2956 stop:4179 length:1224 start_codon:yes stop_codon:yes gene_type:complete
MGAPSITYESPKIEKDDTFEKYLQYQQDREIKLDERAQAARDLESAQTRRRREQGALGFDTFSQNLLKGLESGVTPYSDAQSQLQSYISKYDLKGGFAPMTQTRTRTVYDDVLDDEGKATGERVSRQEEYEYATPGATRDLNQLFDSTDIGDFEQKLLTTYSGTGELDPTTGKYDLGLRGKRFSAGVQKAYRDLLGRESTEEELAQAMSDFKDGAVANTAKFRDDLRLQEEYTKKFNDNYQDNYYDMYYGSSVADRTGEDGTVSKLRKYSFDRSMLPTYEGQEVPETYQGPVDPTTKIPISTEDYMDWAEKRYAKDKTKSEGLNLKERTGITLPDYEEYFKEARSVAELEDQRQSIAQTREFLYSAGLKNLQGNIDKETTKIRIEGQKDLAKIDQATSLYNLINFQM